MSNHLPTEEQKKVPVLCYVDGPWAYFTTQPLENQWGDDWNDAPYEHNAGTPYAFHEHDRARGKEPWEIVKVVWEGPFFTPGHDTSNSRYSVEMINAGQIAWLRTDEWVKTPVAIPAGTPLPLFIEKVRAAGGSVYMEVAD